MHKDLIYNGYTAVPSDYECADGDFAVSLNLIPEDGALHPVAPPAVILNLMDGERVLCIHSVPGQKNYILARYGGDAEGWGIFWQKKDSDATDTEDALMLTTIPDFKDVAVIGNTLVIALEDSLRYFLWKDGSYMGLSDRPPFISIDFGMCKAGTLTNSDTYSILAQCAPGWSAERPQPDKSDLADITEKVYGLLNPAIADSVTSKGYFYQPFFVRYAYRLYDGSHAWHSAPILMLPTTLPPLIKYSDDGTHPAQGQTLKATFELDVNYFSLAYRILTDAPNLSNWSDIVTGIDIFVSPPIYTYDQSKDLPVRPVRTLGNLVLRAQGLTYSTVFIGHYAQSLNDKYTDRTMELTTSNMSSLYVFVEPHENYHNNVRNAHNFYKVAEIDVKSISPMTEMAQLKLIGNDLSSLQTKELMADDYQSHCTLAASSLYEFNSRLNLAGVKMAPAKPFTLRSCTQLNNPGTTVAAPKITVWSRLNGVRCHAVHVGNSDNEEDLFFSPVGNFPRYIYYPDASAYKMEVYISATQKYVVPLTPHDFLNGAYYYRPDFALDPTPTNVQAESAQCAASVNLGSKIYTSEVNNPFIFPLSGINTVGSGTVYAVCSAVKALSQGQFGQFPLYAFTSEGVWALETTSTGTYSAKQPVTRDVCINPQSITQMDSAVLFATQRGIMMLSGSQAQCISDIINSDFPFDVSELPGFAKLHSLLGHTECDCLPIAPFQEFIKNCGIIYDYAHQRIIIFSNEHTYSYVYSLKSKLWGLSFSKIQDSVNSYPEAFAVDSDGKLVDFSRNNPVEVKGLFVTRPLKLDTANIHKTVDSIIQRGYFTKGKVNTVLYASNNLTDWHLVWSSNNHYLRGFRGTPYKFFRIAGVTNLSKGDCIYGASVQFTPRLTNQPR